MLRSGKLAIEAGAQARSRLSYMLLFYIPLQCVIAFAEQVRAFHMSKKVLALDLRNPGIPLSNRGLVPDHKHDKRVQPWHSANQPDKTE